MENETLELLKACKNLLEKYIQLQHDYAQATLDINIMQQTTNNSEEKNKEFFTLAANYVDDTITTTIEYQGESYTTSELLDMKQ